MVTNEEIFQSSDATDRFFVPTPISVVVVKVFVTLVYGAAVIVGEADFLVDLLPILRYLTAFAVYWNLDFIRRLD